MPTGSSSRSDAGKACGGAGQGGGDRPVARSPSGAVRPSTHPSRVTSRRSPVEFRTPRVFRGRAMMCGCGCGCVGAPVAPTSDLLPAALPCPVAALERRPALRQHVAIVGCLVFDIGVTRRSLGLRDQCDPVPCRSAVGRLCWPCSYTSVCVCVCVFACVGPPDSTGLGFRRYLSARRTYRPAESPV